MYVYIYIYIYMYMYIYIYIYIYILKATPLPPAPKTANMYACMRPETGDPDPLPRFCNGFWGPGGGLTRGGHDHLALRTWL